MATKQDIFSNITFEENDLWEFSRYLQRVNWKCLGRDLGLKNSDIDMLSMRHKFDGPLEITNSMVTTWREQFPSDCNLATLLRALVKRKHINTAKSIGEKVLKKRSGHSTKESSQVLEEYIEELKEVEISISFDDDDEEDNGKNASRSNMSVSKEKKKARTSVYADKANETLENMKKLLDDDCGIVYKKCARAHLIGSRVMDNIQKLIVTFENQSNSGKNKKNIHKKLDQLKAYKCTTALFVCIKFFFYNVLDLNWTIDEKDQNILVKPQGKSVYYIGEKLDNNLIEMMKLGKLLMDNINSDYAAHPRISIEFDDSYEFIVNDLNLCIERLVQAKKDLKSYYDSIEMYDSSVNSIWTNLHIVGASLDDYELKIEKLANIEKLDDAHTGMSVQLDYAYDLIVCDLNFFNAQLVKAQKDLEKFMKG